MEKSIKVTKYFKINKESSLVAIFSILLHLPDRGNIFMNRLKLFQKNGHFWVKFPDEEYVKDGEKKYNPYIGFLDRKDHEKFEKEIIEAIKNYNQTSTSIPYPNTTYQKSHSEQDNLPF